MNEIKDEIKIRYNQINQLLEHLKLINSDNPIFWISDKVEEDFVWNIISIKNEEWDINRFSITKINYANDIESITKSSMLLIMYNIIEYTIMNLFDKIHLEFKEHDYSSFKEDIQKILWKIFKEWVKRQNEKDEIINYIDWLLDISDIKKEFSFFIHNRRKEYSYYNYLWWNIKNKSLNNLTKNYLIDNIEKDDYLDDIAEIRNSLAHWSHSFVEVWKRMSVTEIEKKVKCTYDYLLALIDWVEVYLNKKLFIREEN